MVLIIGLGNPGRQFRGTRHNIGFLVLDAFKRKEGFSNWRLGKKLKAKVSEGSINRKQITLAKPQTFMNNSGKAVKLLFENCKLKIENLVVIHDDLDIPLAKMKISLGHGSAGHKGVQSIIDELETNEFIRFRIGIKPVGGATSYQDFVLGKFTKEEQKIIKEVKKKACESLEVAIKEGVERAMSRSNC